MARGDHICGKCCGSLAIIGGKWRCATCEAARHSARWAADRAAREAAKEAEQNSSDAAQSALNLIGLRPWGVVTRGGNLIAGADLGVMRWAA
jgi:NMD protein affecting ribosome stability and mRNA decay